VNPKINEYPFTIRPLAQEEGGGFLIEYPDLPGCISDGETPEEAIRNGRDAVRSYILSCRKYGDVVPTPGAQMSGQWRQRVPKSLHARLVAQARREGVSLNTLVTAMIAEGLGSRRPRTARPPSAA
jgi:antitoxin HicB